MKETANIIIIGGGVIGTSIAFHLAEAGHQDILLLERGPLACGTTPNAAGQTGYLTSHKSALPFSLYCSEFFERFGERTGHPIDFRKNGSLRVALTEQYMRNLQGYLDAAADIGEERVKLVSKADAKEMAPLLELQDEPAGILYNGGDGFVDPKSVAIGFAAGARGRGVEMRTRTPVTKIISEGERVIGVETASDTIAANWVIVAAGAWTRQLVQQVGINIPSVPIQHQAYVTAPIGELSIQQPIVRVIEPQIYLRPEQGGMLVGGYGYRPNSFDMSNFAPDFEIAALPADAISYAELSTTAERFFPILRDLPIIQERRGLPTVTPDGGLILSGLEEAQGLVVATGCQVSGVAYAPSIGKVTADLVSGIPSELTPEREFEAGRFDDIYTHSEAKLRARVEHIYATMYWGSSAYTHLETDS